MYSSPIPFNEVYVTHVLFWHRWISVRVLFQMGLLEIQGEHKLKLTNVLVLLL